MRSSDRGSNYWEVSGVWRVNTTHTGAGWGDDTLAGNVSLIELPMQRMVREGNTMSGVENFRKSTERSGIIVRLG